MMRRCLLGLSMLCAVGASAAAPTTNPDPQTTTSTQPAAPTAPDPDRPEYRVRGLPTDTFKPSERVSEDYPIAFPADI